MNVPKHDRGPRRRSETRDLVQPIIRAMNAIPGVRVTRNANLGPVIPYSKRDVPDVRPIIAGLGTGSADIVGIVMMWHPPGAGNFGRAFALEVKLPSDGRLRGGTLDADQVRWLRIFRKFGGFAAVVRSELEARDAIVRCRAGESE